MPNRAADSASPCGQFVWGDILVRRRRLSYASRRRTQFKKADKNVRPTRAQVTSIFSSTSFLSPHHYLQLERIRHRRFPFSTLVITYEQPTSELRRDQSSTSVQDGQDASDKSRQCLLRVTSLPLNANQFARIN